MQGTGDIGGWYDQGIGNSSTIRIGRKISLRDPESIPFFFYAVRIKTLV
jgi:hypothetical protein